jgi:hypothetical protein
MHMRTLTGILGVAVLVAATPAYSQTPAGQTASASAAPRPPEAEGLTFIPYVDLGFAGDYDNTPAGFGAALGYGLPAAGNRRRRDRPRDRPLTRYVATAS